MSSSNYILLPDGRRLPYVAPVPDPVENERERRAHLIEYMQARDRLLEAAAQIVALTREAALPEALDITNLALPRTSAEILAEAGEMKRQRQFGMPELCITRIQVEQRVGEILKARDQHRRKLHAEIAAADAGEVS
jgi:hypothetical protein